MTRETLAALVLGAFFIAVALGAAAWIARPGGVFSDMHGPGTRDCGTAFLELQKIWEPGAAYVQQVQREDENRDVDAEGEGDPPTTSPTGPSPRRSPSGADPTADPTPARR
jgi:hypothetical protein